MRSFEKSKDGTMERTVSSLYLAKGDSSFAIIFNLPPCFQLVFLIAGQYFLIEYAERIERNNDDLIISPTRSKFFII